MHFDLVLIYITQSMKVIRKRLGKAVSNGCEIDPKK